MRIHHGLVPDLLCLIVRLCNDPPDKLLDGPELAEWIPLMAVQTSPPLQRSPHCSTAHRCLLRHGTNFRTATLPMIIP